MPKYKVKTLSKFPIKVIDGKRPMSVVKDLFEKQYRFIPRTSKEWAWDHQYEITRDVIFKLEFLVENIESKERWVVIGYPKWSMKKI